MRFEEDEVVFTSGRKRYANRGIIGINPNGAVESISEGYDGRFWSIDDYREPEDQLSPDDLVELADYMVAAWARFRDGMLMERNSAKQGSGEGSAL